MPASATSRLPSGAERLHRWAVVFLVTALPLAAWTPFYDCFPLTKWLLLAGAAALVLASSRPGSLPPAFRWAWVWAGWVAVCAIRSDLSPWRSWPESALLVLPVIVAGQAAAPWRLARALVLTAAGMSVLALAQAAGWDEGAWLSPFHKGVASTIGNPDLLGGFLVLPGALALALLWERPGGWRIATALLIGGAVLVTEARAAWLGLLVAVFLLTLHDRRRALLTAVAALALTAGWLAISPGALVRAKSGGALTERVWTWRLAARIVREAPVAGSGPGTFRTRFLATQTAARDRGEFFYHYTEYAHLEPLHLWVELGAIGLGIFGWGLLAAFRGWRHCAWRHGSPGLWRGLGAGASGTLVNALLSFPFHVIPTATAWWLLLGAAAPRPAPAAAGGRGPGPGTLGLRLAALALLLAVPFRLALENTALRTGQVLALAGRLEPAAACFARGARAMDADPRLDWYAASCARQRGDPAAALTRIDAAIRLEPGMYELHHERGMTLKALNRPADAEAAYRQAVRIHPGFASGWNNLGNLLGGEGRLAEAESAQRHALGLDPGSREARQNLAITLLRLGRSREARAVMDGRL